MFLGAAPLSVPGSRCLGPAGTQHRGDIFPYERDGKGSLVFLWLFHAVLVFESRACAS